MVQPMWKTPMEADRADHKMVSSQLHEERNTPERNGQASNLKKPRNGTSTQCVPRRSQRKAAGSQKTRTASQAGQGNGMHVSIRDQPDQQVVGRHQER
jgi:hypothetical protein